MADPKPVPTIAVTVALPLGRIADLLCCAFEGGVRYWCRIVSEEKPAEPPEQWAVRAFEDAVGKPASREHPVYSHIEYPVNGGALLLVEDNDELRDLEERWDDREDPEAVDAPPADQSLVDWLKANDVEVWRLDMDAIKRGCDVMSTKFPRHWANFIAENEDADTGDAFVQCCLFGDLVYG